MIEIGTLVSCLGISDATIMDNDHTVHHYHTRIVPPTGHPTPLPFTRTNRDEENPQFTSGNRHGVRQSAAVRTV